LAEGPIGAIEVVRGSYVRGLKHNGTHWLDLARFLVGEIATVVGRGPVPGDGLDATIDVELEFAAGARGALVGLGTSSYSLFEMDLIGTSGRVRIVDGGQRVEAFGAIASRWFPGFRELAPLASPPGGLSDLVMHAATDLIEAVATGRPPACTGEDAVVVLALATQALATAEERNHATLGC
jgi:predicted dehydrogenase